MRKLIAAAAAALLIAGLASCTLPDRPVTETELKEIAEEAAPLAPAPEPLTKEEEARSVAIAMDPVFADDNVWYNTLPIAEQYCQMAVELQDSDAALDMMVVASIDTGVTAEQVGIISGIGIHIYCPEFG